MNVERWGFVVYGTANKVKVYTVKRTCAVGIGRYVKIKADADPCLPEYAAYYWQRRNNRESKLLSAMSAREHRALAAQGDNSRIVPQE